MQTINAQGASVTAKWFIDLYHEARKIAPPRYLTIRLNQDRYNELYKLADIPESIQVGYTPGPLGKRIMRVTCVKPPLGVGDGIAIQVDHTMPPDRIEISVHGIPEMIIEGLAHNAST